VTRVEPIVCILNHGPLNFKTRFRLDSTSGQLRRHLINGRLRTLLWQDCFHHRCRCWYWAGQCRLFAAAGADRIAIADHIEATTTRTRALKAAIDAAKPAPDIIVLSIDVRDVQSIEAGIRVVSAGWGHVDILINNQGNLPEPEVQSQSLAAKDIES